MFSHSKGEEEEDDEVEWNLLAKDRLLTISELPEVVHHIRQVQLSTKNYKIHTIP